MFALFSALSACNYDVRKTPETNAPQVAPGAPLGFATVFSVIRPKCATCHSAARGDRGGVNLETYQNIFNTRDRIAAEIKAGTMPPPSRSDLLSPEERDLILRWIAAGAPLEPIAQTKESK